MKEIAGKPTLERCNDFVVAATFAILSPDAVRLERLERICGAPWIFEAGAAWQRLAKAGYAYARHPTQRRKDRLKAANGKCYQILEIRDARSDTGGATSGRGERRGSPRPRRHTTPSTPRQGRRQSGRRHQLHLNFGDAA